MPHLDPARSRWYPLGATLCPDGVNFALYSAHASGVVLQLFDRDDGPVAGEFRLQQRTRHVWHGFVAGVGAGQLYGWRVEGPYQPAQGLRFNANKLLVDPYARALAGRCRDVDRVLCGFDGRADPFDANRDLSFDPRDSADFMAKSVVVDDAFDWQDDRPPAVPLQASVLYEVHVKGFTAHPSSGVQQPGTYLGLVEKIPYLRALGITAVELLPVHAHLDEAFLAGRGLTNYWGYSTLGFFAPEPSYGSRRAPGCEVAEFKTMVRELHRAGIEVILDVVYNHTAEGSRFDRTVSLRGIDNPSYYMLGGPPDQPARYDRDFTGCGNCLDPAQGATIRLVMDSLRYWVQVMHVDGFRFDLAQVLGRGQGGFSRAGALFDAIAQDPVLQRVKLIAEPWDSQGNVEVGNFPIDWSEWNNRFRDTVRRYVKGDAGQLADLGWRLTGSADLFADDGRSAYNSINFVTCHDGFTLNDLVSYNGKHNQANGEGNGDGNDDNKSWNCGVEGPSDDPAVNALRRRLAKNHLCLLLLSLGTPMLLAGDEFLRTQHGNNNAYCQDNAISWFDWDAAAREAGMTRFVSRLIGFTRRCDVLLQRRVRGLGADADAVLRWYGTELGEPRWHDPEARTLCLALDGGGPTDPAGHYTVLLICHAGHTLQPVRLPAPAAGSAWHRVLDTSLPDGAEIAASAADEVRLAPADHYLVNPRTTVLLLARAVDLG